LTDDFAPAAQMMSPGSTPARVQKTTISDDRRHTAAMTLKNAATLALIGTLLLTVLLAMDFLNSVLAVTRGLIPAMAILRSLIYFVASLTATMFFYVFNREQPR
jgi:hypothetical protein